MIGFGIALGPKKQLFARDYPVDLNATQAAIPAGFSPGLSGLRGTPAEKG